ncbi:hypothetical protein GJ744_005561 [Endocarpon pusillum]|uniref:Uncharacterized protein n=1 Tax=Endocarpon pusillum TaxID=364733 RepID=A0A8H7E7A3_9EURO|nr:hypothetical protein GJ744_005561 [Endocarpon pusillum]
MLAVTVDLNRLFNSSQIIPASVTSFGNDVSEQCSVKHNSTSERTLQYSFMDLYPKTTATSGPKDGFNCSLLVALKALCRTFNWKRQKTALSTSGHELKYSFASLDLLLQDPKLLHPPYCQDVPQDVPPKGKQVTQSHSRDILKTSQGLAKHAQLAFDDYELRAIFRGKAISQLS